MLRWFSIIVLFVALLSDTVNTCTKSDSNSETHCVLTPEEQEGPYYIPYHLLRKDVREGKPGIKLELKFTVKDEWCNPLPNTTVDIWHCDALGYYSGHLSKDPNQPPPPDDHVDPTDNTTFFRGIQISDANGVVEFVTNFPGWYYGRTIHIHIEVFQSGNTIHTGQIYFTESLTAKVARLVPYSEHNFRRFRNAEDWSFVHQFGNETIILPKQIDAQSIEAGLQAEMCLIVKS